MIFCDTIHCEGKRKEREEKKMLMKHNENENRRKRTGNEQNGNHYMSFDFGSSKGVIQPSRNFHSNESKTTVKPNQSIEECSTMFG